MSGVTSDARQIQAKWLTAAVLLVMLLVVSASVGASGPVVVSFSLSADAGANGMEPIDYPSGKWHVAEAADRLGARLEANNLYLQVDDARLKGGPYRIHVTLEYLSLEEGAFRLEFDSLVNDYAYEKGPFERVEASMLGNWNKVEWIFEGVQFANRQNGNSDMRIRVAGDALALLIGSITIVATPQ